jgi:hypothetical protein
MTGTNCDLFTHNQSRSYLNHLILRSATCFGLVYKPSGNTIHKNISMYTAKYYDLPARKLTRTVFSAYNSVANIAPMKRRTRKNNSIIKYCYAWLEKIRNMSLRWHTLVRAMLACPDRSQSPYRLVYRLSVPACAPRVIAARRGACFTSSSVCGTNLPSAGKQTRQFAALKIVLPASILFPWFICSCCCQQV